MAKKTTPQPKPKAPPKAPAQPKKWTHWPNQDKSSPVGASRNKVQYEDGSVGKRPARSKKK
jgi:hypothetical protein